MDYTKLFQKDLIEINAIYTTQNEMFEKVCDKLFQQGFVKETFKEAIQAREQAYPTGLKTDYMTIAIPHTDAVHVQKPFVYVINLKTSLPFIQMGTNDQWINVDDIFLLGIKEPGKQTGLLSLMMNKVQDEAFYYGYNKISSQKEMEAFLKNNFRSDA